MTTAFVLGGGGRWGAVEVGMLQALGDAGINPDLVLGTSIGAFNGSVVADYPGAEGTRRLTELWNEISGHELFGTGWWDRARRVASFKPGIHDNGEMRLLLQRIHDPERRIEDLTVPFQCVAACIERSSEHWFSRGPLIEALLASSAIPALFNPVEIGGEHFYDGGLVNSVPIDRAIRLGATRIYVLQVGRLEAPLRAPQKLHEAALISFEIARRHRVATQLEDLPEGLDLHLLPSANPVQFDDRRQLRWRDTSATQELIEGARLATEAYLQGLYG